MRNAKSVRESVFQGHYGGPPSRSHTSITFPSRSVPGRAAYHIGLWYIFISNFGPSTFQVSSEALILIDQQYADDISWIANDVEKIKDLNP